MHVVRGAGFCHVTFVDTFPTPLPIVVWLSLVLVVADVAYQHAVVGRLSCVLPLLLRDLFSCQQPYYHSIESVF